ncbi:MAG TPA: deoxyribodipyrimidine photo-lyase, partial [Bryobacteraceae bacterium]|nr:deoxyribodipyrimidine photo-lyase [Bryobacteraceae bacterium]
MPVEPDRIRTLNSAPPRETADYVLYWSQMNRRAEANHALAHAIHLANERKLPLLVYEGLTCTYRQANDRLHTFVMEAVPETQKQIERLGAGYVFYLRARRSDANDLVYRLCERAACIVTDDYPTFIAAHHNGRVPGRIGIPYIAVDSSCIVPMSRHEKRAYAAYAIRPKIRRELPQFFKPLEMPRLNVRWQEGLLPAFARRLRTEVTGSNVGELVAGCEIDHRVPPSITFRGGYGIARKRLRVFLSEKLRRYAKERNQPAAHATSGLSPYLHFGQIAALEVALAVRDYAEEHKLIADEFLEELI